MINTSKNKLLTWLVILLLAANAVSLAFFWIGKARPPIKSKDGPQKFLVERLQMDSQQQKQFGQLVLEHRKAAATFREKIRESKEAFFSLLKKPGLADSEKQAAAGSISQNTEALDLLTFDHFRKVRALLTVKQQEKFDDIIEEVTNMIGQQRPPGMPGNNMHGPPPGGHERNGLPPGPDGKGRPPNARDGKGTPPNAPDDNVPPQ